MKKTTRYMLLSPFSLPPAPYSLIPIFFTLLLCLGSSEAQVPETHKECTSCHIEEGPPALKGGTNETCVKCHPIHPGRDHPVNVVQKNVPDRLPLDRENRITCVTCHEPHGKGTVERLLRMEFNKLCIVCHKS